jgi:molybdopterin-guanine dinucleotide biosynthesis protein A
LQLATLERLAEVRRADVDAVVPLADGRIHPLCGMFHSRLSADVELYLRSGERRVMGWVESLGSRCLTLNCQDVASQFRNFNRPEDFS